MVAAAGSLNGFFQRMHQDPGRTATAQRLIENMKRCAGLIDELIADASAISPEEDVALMRSKACELLGSLYLDIYRKNLLPEFPEFSGSLESGE